MKKKPAPYPVAGDAPSADGDLIARAVRKVVDRQALTDRERAALKRHEREREERLRWRYCHLSDENRPGVIESKTGQWWFLYTPIARGFSSLVRRFSRFLVGVLFRLAAQSVAFAGDRGSSDGALPGAARRTGVVDAFAVRCGAGVGVAARSACDRCCNTSDQRSTAPRSAFARGQSPRHVARCAGPSAGTSARQGAE